MNPLRIAGILLLVSALVVGFVSQSRWHLLATQKPTEMVSSSRTTQADGTIVNTVDVVVHAAEIRWSIVLPLIGVFIAGVACLCFARTSART